MYYSELHCMYVYTLLLTQRMIAALSTKQSLCCTHLIGQGHTAVYQPKRSSSRSESTFVVAWWAKVKAHISYTRITSYSGIRQRYHTHHTTHRLVLQVYFRFDLLWLLDARVVVQVGALGLLALLLFKKRRYARRRDGGSLGRHALPGGTCAREGEREGERGQTVAFLRPISKQRQSPITTQHSRRCLRVGCGRRTAVAFLFGRPRGGAVDAIR